MRFTTERTEVRPWRREEAARLLDIRRRPEVARWLSDPTPWTELATAEEHIAAWEERAAAPDGFGTAAIVPFTTGVPVGTVKIDRLPGDEGELEVGWTLHPDATGQGYAREAARGAVELARLRGVARLWAVMWPDNHASARVCLALGMEDLGVIDDPWYGTDEEPTSRIFRLGLR